MQTPADIRLRFAQTGDLDDLNAVIEAAVMGWNLPERVKRLSLPSYRYQEHDLDHLRLLIAETGTDGIVGVAAWEPAAAGDAPTGAKAMLLHGLYVAPRRQLGGIGTRLLEAAATAARQAGCDGLLVKANPDAQGFFAHRGLDRLLVEDPTRDYPYRYWLPLSDGP